MALTICLRSIPHHDTTEGRVLALRGLDDGLESVDGNVTSLGGAGRGGNTHVDLDVLVRRLSLSPVIPRVQSVARLLTDRDQYSPSAKVPVIGVAVLS